MGSPFDRFQPPDDSGEEDEAEPMEAMRQAEMAAQFDAECEFMDRLGDEG